MDTPQVKVKQFLVDAVIQSESLGSNIAEGKYSVSAPPGEIEKRVFIGGNYALMPVLRRIESVVASYGFQPIIANDFDIPKEKTRDYTLRLLYQCKYAIFEVTLANGHTVELARVCGFKESKIFQVFMAMDEERKPPKTMSIMVWQSEPPPQGYVIFEELDDLVVTFLIKAKK